MLADKPIIGFLTTTDTDRARVFFRDTLGLKLISEDPFALVFRVADNTLRISTVEALAPGDYLERFPTNQVATPSTSSWGAKGYSEQWLNETNAWLVRHLHRAGERMIGIAQRYRENTDPLLERALNQTARELMLAQCSDWPFIMSTGTTVPYATRRFNEHVLRFNKLCDGLDEGRVDEALLTDIESKDNLFPRVDFRIYAR